jgi:large subunit ribosomal protein L30e|eukprot:g3480.t1
MPKKNSGDNINSKLKLVIKSGKYKLGYKETLKLLRQGKARLVIMANNCPTLRQSEIEYYAMLAKVSKKHNTPTLIYAGDNNALGTACGKYFRVSCMTVVDPGDSDILPSSSSE